MGGASRNICMKRRHFHIRMQNAACFICKMTRTRSLLAQGAKKTMFRAFSGFDCNIGRNGPYYLRSRLELACYLPNRVLSKTSLIRTQRLRDVAQSHTPIGVFIRSHDMATGTVKFFNTQKGFGFIQPVDGGNDVFVHISAVERAGMSTLHEGQKLNYEVISERGKLAASNLEAV